MIKPGATIPDVPVKRVDASGIHDASSAEMLGTGLVVFFTVPGAFTPTCSEKHLPGFIANAPKFEAAGVTAIVCGAVNDHHVMKAWGAATGAFKSVQFLADGNGTFARALGLQEDKTDKGMGTRFARSAMVINNGVLDAIFVEDAPGSVETTGASAILMALEAGRV